MCPECGTILTPRWIARLANVAASGATAVTLAACYGLPIEDFDGGTGFCPDPTLDLDSDGYCGEFDCDEGNSARHAFRPDVEGDGIDQNCDGVDGMLGDGGPVPDAGP